MADLDFRDTGDGSAPFSHGFHANTQVLGVCEWLKDAIGSNSSTR